MIKKNIYLIGLMGAGKSTVGKLLAQKLDWHFQDLDEEIERESDQTIAQIFSESGEAVFRQMESATLLRTEMLQNTIIACGGGVVTSTENLEFLKEQSTIWLVLSPEEAAARLEYATDRPLLSRCKDTLQKLGNILEARQEAYARASTLQINVGEKSPDTIVDQVMKELSIRHV
ncbi:MAG: shikimate kinase [Candidatus Marinimicrobia bacterium]|nr:shikimate kinase [Candidatus Neomarinimicrobiota bacterium]MCF7850249.1 shikimate kinase [Candidatus Neomarinimicrobiota bacterium]MCF7903709.1 shikimate kinase [Candidatus Neomarinimicrobiota bacterium]